MKDIIEFQRRKFLRVVNSLLMNAESIYKKLESESHHTEYELTSDVLSVTLRRLPVKKEEKHE